MLEPIDDANLDDAFRLLVEGFPGRSEDFWRTGLERARPFVVKDADWPIGFLLRRADRFAGIIFTLTSGARDGTPSQGPIVNLSSWYLKPDSRALAPMMLMKVMEHAEGLFTDLTPTSRVADLLGKLKFTQWGGGRLLVSWPQTLLAKTAQSTIRSLDEVREGALDPAARQILEDHQRLGCYSAALFDGEDWQPLIFVRKRILGIPAGYVVYARSRQAILTHRRTVTAFLLRKGMTLLCLDADPSDCPPGCIFVARKLNKFYRGSMPKDRIDYAYSELVYFKLY